ncbi:hypothetical protein [Mycoplasmopsis columbinasalis]|uniref:Uncharacterized protein n=1 Tax=Mycoplasmopsis columbinasalis TaxID=114880 RepID=A0A449B9W2_9BACT|nr:hypothetical protein [Mycoplasmopsis columbinasalis]VEU77970.1 Uncharacterised protein [Mycoplasmopsis columbinasalis]
MTQENMNLENLNLQDPVVKKVLARANCLLSNESFTALQNEFSNEEIVILAQKILELHNQKETFDKNLIAREVKFLRTFVPKNSQIFALINPWFKKINQILAKMNDTRPNYGWVILRNKDQSADFNQNFREMGDKHWDLALFCIINNLSLEQEELFLNNYDEYYLSYFENHKLLVSYYLVLLFNFCESIYGKGLNTKLFQKVKSKLQLK